MVSSVWRREAGAASDWLAHPMTAATRETGTKIESFRGRDVADCVDLHLEGDSQGSRRLTGSYLLFKV